MADRSAIASGVSAAESTIASTTLTEKLAVTIPAAGQDADGGIFVFWSCMVGATTSASTRARLVVDGALVQEFRREDKNTSDYVTFAGVVRVVSAATPADIGLAIQFARIGLSGTVAIKEARIVAIKEQAGDEYAESLALSTTTDNSFQDKVTLSFTPASQGDYLFVNSAAISYTTTATDVEFALHDGSGNIRTLRHRHKESADFLSWFTIAKGTALSGSQTWKSQFRDAASATAEIQYATLLALRLDTFEAAQYAESNAASTTTDTTYQDKTTLSFTPEAVEHLLLSTSYLGHGATTSSVFAQVDKGGSALQAEMLVEASVAGTTSPLREVHGLVHLEALAAASTTWKTQWHAEANTSAIAESAIAVLQLEAAGGGADHDLLAEDITATPELGTPSLAQVHALTALGITVAPSLALGALAQVHALTADDLVAAPSLGTPVLSESHALTAEDIEAAASLGEPSLAQVHALGANDAAAGAPTLGTPNLAESHALLADDIAAGVPSVAKPQLAQVHALTADDVVGGLPAVGSPNLAQVHALFANAIVTEFPFLSSPHLSAEGGAIVIQYPTKGIGVGVSLSVRMGTR